MNNTSIDLNKIIFCRLRYLNNLGHRRIFKPSQPTIRGQEFDPKGMAFWHIDYPHETLLERARRLEVLDMWEEVCEIKLQSHYALTYRGTQALKFWERWNAHLHSGNKGKKK